MWWAEQPYPLVPFPDDKTSDSFLNPAIHMAIVHNCIIRSLNAIIIQAPFISRAELPDFIHYAKLWIHFVHTHHDIEEEVLFPRIALESGDADVMATNIEQHHAFTLGLDEMDAYLTSCLPASPSTGAESKAPAEPATVFDGKTLVSIINSFAPALTTHLAAEIPSLIALQRFGAEKLDMEKITFDTAMVARSKTGMEEIAFLATSLDRTIPWGEYKNFPPMPPLADELFARVGVWKFAPSSKESLPKEKPEVKGNL